MDYRAGERMEDWLTTNHVLSSHFPGHFSLYPLSSYTTAKNNALWDSTQLHGEYVLGCLDRVASQYHRQVKDRPALHGLFLWRKSNYWMNNEAKLLQIGWDWVECRCPFLYTVTHTRSKIVKMQRQWVRLRKNLVSQSNAATTEHRENVLLLFYISYANLKSRFFLVALCLLC